MSVVQDRVNSLKSQLNTLAGAQIQSLPQETPPPSSCSIYLTELNESLSILSTPSHTTPSLAQISRLLIEVNHAKLQEQEHVTQSEYAKELEWLFLARCTVDVYGCLLEQLFQQTLPLAQDIWYWDDVLSQPTWRLLYLIQSPLPPPATRRKTDDVASPYRFLQFGKAAWQNTLAHLRETHTQFSMGTLRASLLDRNLFRRIAFPTRLPDALGAIDSSVASLCRHEIETNLTRLRALRELQAAGLGLLVSEGIDFAGGRGGWKEGVVRGVDLMKSTMEWLQNIDVEVESFDHVDQGTLSLSPSAELTIELVNLKSTPVMDIASVSTNLLNLAQNILPNQDTHTSSLATIYGRPSYITRYWPIGVTILFSGSTILRILVNKRAQLTQWLRDSYTTIIDFWRNWVITPISDIISTIRHEDSSQIALMGRQSLQSDMDSLERMVVQFARENQQYLPSNVPGDLDAFEIVRKGVREGDLSPVLRAYETDLRTPVRSALTGTLIQTLLIQIQKTKVDVEVALSGIDRLLKSQQLVFGFVGVTPSLIILYTFTRYLSSLPSRRRGLRQGIAKGDLVKTMRSIERILCLHDMAKGAVLTFRDRGLVLCECYVASEFAGLLPRGVRREFMQDLGDLENVNLGVERQLRTIARMWRVWRPYLT